MGFAPLSDRILIRPEPAVVKTASGIIIPDNAQEKPKKGTVVAAGPGRYENGVFVATTVKTGDIVVYGKWSGQEITIDDEVLLILEESQLLGVLVV